MKSGGSERSKRLRRKEFNRGRCRRGTVSEQSGRNSRSRKPWIWSRRKH